MKNLGCPHRVVHSAAGPHYMSVEKRLINFETFVSCFLWCIDRHPPTCLLVLGMKAVIVFVSVSLY